MGAAATQYRVGAKVESPVGCIGTVADVSNGSVVVRYYEKKVEWKVIYTPEWFQKWGQYLKVLNVRTA